MSKYNNKIIEVDNIKFHSEKETNRYRELLLLVKAKTIKELELQPKFELQGGFTDSMGEKHRPIYYIGDFLYKEVGNKKYTVEDVKGMKTDVYKIKKKLFLYKYPEFIFMET